LLALPNGTRPAASRVKGVRMAKFLLFLKKITTLFMLKRVLFSLFVISMLSPVVYSASGVSGPFIYDSAQFLNTAQVRELNRILENYQENLNLKLVLCTVDSLSGLPVKTISEKVFKELGYKGPGYYHTAMILLSGKEKKLGVVFSSSLEWKIPDQEALYLKREMVNYFRSGNFYQGIKNGFEQIAFSFESEDWELDSEVYQNLQNEFVNSINKVMRLECSTVTRQFSQEKIGEEQFMESYFIFVKDTLGKLVKIRFSKNALEQIQKLMENKGGVVYVRIINSNPLDTNFLGYEL